MYLVKSYITNHPLCVYFVNRHSLFWQSLSTETSILATRSDNINIKHLGPIAIKQLTNLFNITINTNTIVQIWKTSKIIPIAKQNKDPSLSSSYRPIASLSLIAKTLEKIIFPHINTASELHTPPPQPYTRSTTSYSQVSIKKNPS